MNQVTNFFLLIVLIMVSGCTHQPKSSNQAVTENDSIKEIVFKLIEDNLGVEEKEIVPDASFTNDLGADDLDMVELVIELEYRFHISIPDEDAERLNTVQDVLDYLHAHVK